MKTTFGVKFVNVFAISFYKFTLQRIFTDIRDVQIRVTSILVRVTSSILNFVYFHRVRSSSDV